MKSAYYKKYLFLSLLLVANLSMLQGCQDIKDHKTTLEAIDNNRHYYPILRGQELEVVFDIKNIGAHPFILTDLIISCGCIVNKQSSIQTIPPNDQRRIILTYDSAKNIGYVQHFVDIYGNLEKQEKITLVFDTNVVPESAYTKDYEEIYLERRERAGNFKGWVEGEEKNKGYYIDEK